jgi:hypothetical protein
MTSDITNNAPEGSAETSPIDWLKDSLQRVDALPCLDSRTADEILGYDEEGIPS